MPDSVLKREVALKNKSKFNYFSISFSSALAEHPLVCSAVPPPPIFVVSLLTPWLGAQHRSVPAGEIYYDLTSAVSGSEIADGVDGRLSNTIFFWKVAKQNKTFFFCGPHLLVFNSPASYRTV
jgi:hypothetical protein